MLMANRSLNISHEPIPLLKGIVWIVCVSEGIGISPLQHPAVLQMDFPGQCIFNGDRQPSAGIRTAVVATNHFILDALTDYPTESGIALY